MEWVNLVISSHKSYEYEAQWHGGGMYGGYVETDPRPLLIVCSFNIAFLAALLWTLPVKKTASFIAASVGAFALLLSLAYCHANIYFFIYLLYLIMSINVIFRDETCNAMFNFFIKSEHKADLYTFISIVMVYLLFLFYFANIVASFIVCVSLVANYFIVVHKISNTSIVERLNREQRDLAVLEGDNARLARDKTALEGDNARLIREKSVLGKELSDLEKDIASKKKEGTRQSAIIAENKILLDEISGHREIVDKLIRKKLDREGDNAKLAADKGDARAARFWAQAGNAALAADTPDAALAALDKALASQTLESTERADSEVDRARALVALNRPADAEAALTTARKLSPENGTAWLLSATLARRMNKLADALSYIQTTAALLPRDAAVALEAGNIAIAAGDEAAARKQWQQSIAIAPNSRQAATATAQLAALAASAPPPTEPPSR
jgi:tetratricopeptide (TPR) repeat protein